MQYLFTDFLIQHNVTYIFLKYCISFTVIILYNYTVSISKILLWREYIVPSTMEAPEKQRFIQFIWK